MQKTILISACLLGVHTKYDGGNNLRQEIVDVLSEAIFVPFCPEQLGGLPTPRSPVEITAGSGSDVLTGHAMVTSRDGQDFTAAFIKGARESLLLAQRLSAQAALLKARSPSCGCGSIYDGTFTGGCTTGDGVAAALLKQAGLPVFTEEQFTDFLQWL